MGNGNIKYISKQISDFYSSNRQRWDDLYLSERMVFGRINREQPLGNILDVGCACGGLGSALHENFFVSSYTGVDINNEAIEWAKKNIHLTIPSKFISGDILDVNLMETFETVVSLSCADWNIETDDIINACWSRLKNGGFFIISLRLSPLQGINDIKKSFQFINFSREEKEPEIANYVVFNFKEALTKMKMLRPQSIGAYGYWGKPSQTARTPYKKLVFAVFYLKKGTSDHGNETIPTELNLPVDIFL
jgi:SAM-dependent methyltransferase